MQLEHSFSVPVSIDEAWRILMDIERIGPCLPGAKIESVDGDDFTGSVKVKLGPINLTYKGKATFLEKDEAARRAVIDARGRDARGNGTAAAKVTATLAEGGGRTTVHVNTDLDVTGKPAQFGRGVMVDVGNKLLGQFAACLAQTLGAGEPEASADATAPPIPAELPAEQPPATPAPTTPATEEDETAADVAAATAVAEPMADTPPIDPAAEDRASATAAAMPRDMPPAEFRPDVAPINLLESAGPALAKRLAPVAVALVVLLIAVRRVRRRD